MATGKYCNNFQSEAEGLARTAETIGMQNLNKIAARRDGNVYLIALNYNSICKKPGAIWSKWYASVSKKIESNLR